MNDAPVCGRHRLQGYAAIGLRYPRGDFCRHVPQGVLPALAVVLHIQHHTHALSHLLTDDEGNQKL